MRDSHKILVVIFFKDSTEEIYRNRIDLILLQSERKVKRSSKIDFFFQHSMEEIWKSI